MRSVGAELFHADRQTDRQTDRHDDANSCFWNFANAPKIVTVRNRTLHFKYCSSFCCGI